MSQHYFDTRMTWRDGKSVRAQVTMGWDRPLAALFLQFQRLSDEGKATMDYMDGGMWRSLPRLRGELEKRDVSVPLSMLAEVLEDAARDAGNRIVDHTGSSACWPRLPAEVFLQDDAIALFQDANQGELFEALSLPHSGGVSRCITSQFFTWGDDEVFSVEMRQRVERLFGVKLIEMKFAETPGDVSIRFPQKVWPEVRSLVAQWRELNIERESFSPARDR